MKIQSLLCSLFLILFGCTTQAQIKISAEEFQKKLKEEKDYQLIDVRTKNEYKEGHIKEALNIDYNSSDFSPLIAQLDKNKPTYIYCLSGGRSSAALKVLQEKGFKEVYELDGGIRKWKEANKPLEAYSKKEAGITKKEFDKIIQSERLVLVDFGAVWCGPCKKMAPTIDKLSKDKEIKAKILKIDVDQSEQLSQQLNIEVLPTLHLYKDKKLVWEHAGFLDEKGLRKVISEYSNH